MEIYEELCRRQGLLFRRTETGIQVKGPLHFGRFPVPGNISSQFITGLLFALPLLKGDSRLEILPPVESRSYIRMTLEILRDFGICIKEEGDTLLIPGNQTYQERDYTVEGDYSNGAFLEALGLISPGKEPVQVLGLKEDSLQGDRIFRQYFSVLKAGEGLVDLQDCPDLGPVLMAVAAAFGGGHFVNTARLKIKESDRGMVMAEELAKFGIAVTCLENEIFVEKGRLQKPEIPLCGHNDHRIAMALSLLCTRTGGVLEGAQCVNKSYPGFFEDMQKLGIGVELLWQ
jgi:3-phosphoshikimate 1-carboxyvinyltransferase